MDSLVWLATRCRASLHEDAYVGFFFAAFQKFLAANNYSVRSWKKRIGSTSAQLVALYLVVSVCYDNRNQSLGLNVRHSFGELRNKDKILHAVVVKGGLSKKTHKVKKIRSKHKFDVATTNLQYSAQRCCARHRLSRQGTCP